jgi:predicted lipoprotein with Yx(FWY)xxD motif
VPALLALAALALIAAGCGSDDSSEETTPEAAAAETATPEPEPEPAEPASKPKPKPKGTALTTAGSQFGDVLFDEDQRAIYIFDKEQSSESECYGDCAVEWPPVLTKGDPQAEGAVKSGKLGTTKRDDGKLLVTYEGQPLYYYHDDPDGVVGCHNVPGFGGLWLAIDASGAAV